jgi:RNA polymerase sigma factor (sigma-70 family)
MLTVQATTVIYVIDDNANMLLALARLLSMAGYTVRRFASAAEFLDQHRCDSRGCIVSDLRMPGMSGIELQSALARGDNPLPMVFLSGHGDIATSVQTIKRGAEDFLTKPVQRDALLAAVERALAQDAATSEQRAQERRLGSNFAKLTRREREVLTHLISGKLNKEIAAILGTTESTIKAHRGKVMKKLQVRSPAELGRLTHQFDP